MIVAYDFRFEFGFLSDIFPVLQNIVASSVTCAWLLKNNTFPHLSLPMWLVFPEISLYYTGILNLKKFFEAKRLGQEVPLEVLAL